MLREHHAGPERARPEHHVRPANSRMSGRGRANATTSVAALLELQRRAGNGAVHHWLVTVQRTKTDYQAQEGPIPGVELLRMVEQMTAAALPELSGRKVPVEAF